MEIYRNKISQDVDIESLSDSELTDILDQIGRNLIYNYLLFGQDVTYGKFVENLNIYLNIIERTI
jgi:hypothetical protein